MILFKSQLKNRLCKQIKQLIGIENPKISFITKAMLTILSIDKIMKISQKNK